MIGIGTAISHTAHSIQYGWNQDKEAKVVYKKYLVGDNPKEVSNEFELIQSMNSNCIKNTFSFVISPTIKDGEKMKLKDLKKVTTEFINELKLEEHQAIAFVHNDKNHKHIHLYVNRIDFQGKAYDDSFIGKRSQKTAEKVALKLNLKTVKQVRDEKLDNLKGIRKYIRNKHLLVFGSFNTEDSSSYISQMDQYGIKVKAVINKSGKLQGLRYEYMDISLKGSEVHRSMSINKLKEKINNIIQNNNYTL